MLLVIVYACGGEVLATNAHCPDGTVTPLEEPLRLSDEPQAVFNALSSLRCGSASPAYNLTLTDGAGDAVADLSVDLEASHWVLMATSGEVILDIRAMGYVD